MSICYDVCIHFIGCVWENDEPKERQKAMNRKIWKALGIAVCMLALAAPRAMAKTYEVWTSDKFAEAVQEINNKSSDEKNEIVLMQDITLGGNPNEYTLYTLSRGNTTIKGGGNKITISNAGITVTGEKTTLNLGEKGYKGTLTIDGKTSGGFVTVSGRATANMYENVTLQNWQFARNACVVVKGLKPVTGPNSAFNMYGGVIENCSRAVIAYSWATFHMFDGEIKKCKADGDDVISVTDNSKFIMEGGTISGCKANTGGGLYANNSAIEISGGTISGCTAEAGGGLYVDGSTINITGGIISGCEGRWGGGLYATNSSKITINNGTISGCKAQAYKDGGGLYADNSAININKGTISGCDGRWGGGLYAKNSLTITITDSTISGCKAGAGGGLFVTGSTLNIEDDIISECTASDTGKGGGLYAENSTLTISGGRIENNKAAYGGGVALVKSKVKVEEPITNWTVVDNEAYKTDTGSGYIGGGIYLESGSMDVSNGSNKIYNNTADGHGADICLTDDTSSIKLPNAANMGATYRNSGIKIDGWYNDDNPRYTPSESGVPVKVDGAEPLKGALSLVASYKADPVHIKIDTNGGKGGSGSQTVQKGTTVTLEAPTREGHLFKGWKDEEKGNSYPAGEDGKVNITATGDMTLTAEWKKLPSAENLPKTGDESPVLLWGAALAVSAAACFVLRRKK